MQNIIRKVIIGAVFIVILVLVGVTSYIYMVAPRVTIHGQQGSIVTVVNSTTGKTVNRQILSADSSTIPLAGDQYKVTVTKDGKEQDFYITGKLFQNQNLQAYAGSLVSSNVISHQVAYDIIKQGGNLISYNTTDRAIEKIDAQGRVTKLYPPALQSALATSPCGECILIPQAFQPIAGNKAIAIFNNIAYILENGTYTPLSADGLPASSQGSISTVAGDMHQDSFVIGVNKAIYLYTSSGARPKLLTTLDKSFDRLSFGGNQIIAYSTRMPFARENLKAHYNNFAIDPIVINSTTLDQKTVAIGPITFGSVSPEGTYALIQKQGDKSINVYSLPQFNFLYSSQSGDTLPTWINDNQYTYGKNLYIWQSDVQDRSERTVSDFTSIGMPSAITADPQDGYLYISYFNGDTSAGIAQMSSE